MPSCKSCAAPLPAYTSLCEYCGAKNDIDLQGISEFTVAEQSSDRKCPLCTIPMETLGIEKIPGFYIEKCASCRGLFFDPEELNVLLDTSVDQVYSIDLKKIWSMNQMEKRTTERVRAYIKCPVCGQLMNRVNFGIRSGVIIDQCRHGVWLDDGELLKLLEWRKAGGQLFHEKIMTERAEREQKEHESKELRRIAGDFAVRSSPLSRREPGTIDLISAAEAAAHLVWRLFT